MKIHKHYNFNVDVAQLSRYICVLAALLLPLAKSCAILLLIASLLSLFTLTKTKSLTLIQSPIIFLVLLYFLIYIVAITYSVGDFYSIKLSMRKTSKILALPLLYASFSCSQQDKHSLLKAMLLGCLILWVHSTFKCYQHYFLSINKGRPLLLANSIVIGLYMLLGFLIAFAGYISTAGKWRYYYLLASTLFMFYLLALSWNKNAVVTLIILLPFLLYTNRQYLDKKIIIAAITLILAFNINAYFYQNQLSANLSEPYISATDFLQGQHNHYASTSERLKYYIECFKLITKKPILGYGTGSFPKIFKYAADSYSYPVTNPHNQYLLVWIEQGLLGLLVLCSLYFALLRSGAFESEDFLRINTQGFAIIFIVGSFFNSWLYDFVPFTLFILFTAVLASPTRTPAN